MSPGALEVVEVQAVSARLLAGDAEGGVLAVLDLHAALGRSVASTVIAGGRRGSAPRGSISGKMKAKAVRAMFFPPALAAPGAHD